MKPYVMAMCRPAIKPVFNSSNKVQQEILDENLTLCCDHISRASAEHNARLIVFPEFTFTGYGPLTNADWVEAGVTFPGPETDRFAEAAQKANAYVVVQAVERHDAFPGRYFLSAIIITPAGDIGLKYRKNYTISLRTSPIDVYDQYIAEFGVDAFFPVLDTPLGVLALSIGAEPHWPEAIRELSLRGAEVVLNPVGSLFGVDYMKRPGAELVRGTRAFENMLYFGMTNIVGEQAADPQIFDFNGANIGEDANYGMTLAEVDIEALRLARKQPGANFLAQIQTALHRELNDFPLWPKNTFPNGPTPGAEELLAVEKASWQRWLSLSK
ncbi:MULTISPECIES: nitrilase-related carbon-nitrogen hydrolase [Aliiglaciecola]|uniref:nitrilase-related carbon-nitrogen hydrolase n=1 Tax=Aliiglaciecola TaxID=1406885 RepID=UPI001C08E9AF|nr:MULTISPECIES: nitrilase-related carbon-nitrogen hydrolase [Aliiglaciecola]MBU2878987.1 hypothetical protein [Aliiglaciecola lipolytica]MDO6710688.1 nitrilase-related carbon-nitrogen hydrolase [Aliiglaciecola sp. 2_MG-2023]MDO6751904.1 nitrilase-related carbon-nitrogen hydrolase [Aliiglaciecola sp. 1_MG-2023]